MKTNKLTIIVLLTVLFTGACKQSPIIPLAPEVVTPETPTKGSADFTKFIALGDSYTAGMMSGALFNDGQAVSMAKILATQFATVGGGVFNQPDINSVNGFNSSASNPGLGVIRGRFVLFDADGATDPDGSGCLSSRSAGPRAAGTPETTTSCPSVVVTPAMPAPYNTADLPGAFTGDKNLLNNFGVPGTRVFHTTAAAFGDPTPGVGNPYYARFASAPGTSLLLTDAATKGGNFFMLYLGIFDILNYATTGGVGSNNGTGANDLTPEAVFNPSFDANLNALLAVPNSKGVVGTIPDITTIPFFFTVTWNAIEFKSTNCTDAATLATLNGPAGFGGYNGALDFLASAAGGNTITPEEAAKRKVVYAYGKNGILIKDKTLANISAALGAINAALAAYGQVRQANATDLITLAAGGVLGTCPNPPNSPSFVSGVSAPLDDQYVLLPSEIADIQARTLAFNTKIKAAADAANATEVRVAVADVYQAYKDLVTNKVYFADNVTIAPTFAPPAGAFSEDGVHPNSRGYAFTANVFINAINSKFGATIPKANLSSYSGTKLPITP